jgi:hypothetical protein
MWPYQPNSDALRPPPAPPPFAVEPVLPLPLRDVAPAFVVALFSFFSDFSLAFAGLGFVFGEGLWDALARRILFGVGFGGAFGVSFGFGVGEDGFGFGVGVDVGAGFGVGKGNSISLFAGVTADFSSTGSWSFRGFGSTA